MFEGLINLLSEITYAVCQLIAGVVNAGLWPVNLDEYFLGVGFNIYLFSDSGWFTEDIPIMYLLYFILVMIIVIFLIRLLWKGTKKFINMVFGVFKL